MRFHRRFKQGRLLCLSEASSLWQMVLDPKALNFKLKLLCNFNGCLRPFTRFEHITHRANTPPIWVALRSAINRSIVMRWALSHFITEPPA